MINEKATKMLNELRKSHEWCCIKLVSDYCYVWNVVLTRGHPHNDDHKPTIWGMSCEDINEAIESAYNQAIEYLEKEDEN